MSLTCYRTALLRFDVHCVDETLSAIEPVHLLFSSIPTAQQSFEAQSLTPTLHSGPYGDLSQLWGDLGCGRNCYPDSTISTFVYKSAEFFIVNMITRTWNHITRKKSISHTELSKNKHRCTIVSHCLKCNT